jgi:hypothetical protein
MSGSSSKGRSETAGMGEDFYGQLAAMVTQLFKETTPLRQDLIGQMEAALRGETEGGMIPVISRAVESARQAASRTEQATTDELARTGLSGTPFGASILGQTRAQGEQAATQTETNILQQLIAGVPNFVLGQGQTAMGAGASAGGASESKTGGMSTGMSL